MAGVFGTHNYGKVDQVPGAFYVVTQFFHVNFVPLLPLTTYVVLAGSESFWGFSSFQGKKIQMSLKSVLTAYSRAALVIGLLITAGVAAFEFLDGVPKGDVEMLFTSGVLAFVSVGCGVVFWLTYRMAHASAGRALQLADELGLSHALVLRCLNPNRSPADLPELEPAGPDDRDYDRSDRDRDYNRDYDRSERARDYDRRERDYDRRGPDPDYDRRDY